VRTRLILALAIVGSLLFAGSAAARDVNRDRIPDRWEKRHGLSLKVDQARRDQDDDGFKNRAEWRAKTDPRDEDTDGDGVPDADENAGTVTSYADGVLTVTLFDGGELAGAVDEDTRITCGSADDAAAKSSAHDPDDDDPSGRGDDDWRDDDEDDQGGDRGDHGDRGGHDHRDCDDEECDDTALVAGAAVEEATLKITSTGRVWADVDLR